MAFDLTQTTQLVRETPQFVSLWCEYDYGQEGYIFPNHAAAMRWLDEAILNVDGEEFAKENNFSAATFDADGLAGTRPAIIVAGENWQETVNQMVDIASDICEDNEMEFMQFLIGH